jgi:hypothetical protein
MIGFVMGYVLGTRAGADGERQLRTAWATITSSEEVRSMAQGGLSMIVETVRRGRSFLAARLADSEGQEATISRIA